MSSRASIEGHDDMKYMGLSKRQTHKHVAASAMKRRYASPSLRWHATDLCHKRRTMEGQILQPSCTIGRRKVTDALISMFLHVQSKQWRVRLRHEALHQGVVLCHTSWISTSLDKKFGKALERWSLMYASSFLHLALSA